MTPHFLLLLPATRSRRPVHAVSVWREVLLACSLATFWALGSIDGPVGGPSNLFEVIPAIAAPVIGWLGVNLCVGCLCGLYVPHDGRNHVARVDDLELRGVVT